jgi:hypothetical protein
MQDLDTVKTILRNCVKGHFATIDQQDNQDPAEQNG